ncbi:MAG: sodium:solute symporter [Dehalococcoidia bacterium]
MITPIIVALYFAAMIAVSVVVYRKGKASTSSGFFVAARKGSTPLIVGSLCATIMGSSVVVGMAGLGYTRGLSGAWWLLAGTVGLSILFLFFARKVRSLGLYTLPEVLESQYGGLTGLAASILIVVAWIAVIAGQIVAAGKILTVILPGNLSLMMAIAAFVFIIYTVLGGQYSVLHTDLIQFSILGMGLLVSAWLVFSQVGGVGGLASSLPQGHLSFPVSPGFGWANILSFLVLVGGPYIVGPDIYSRLFCARNEAVARSSAGWAALTTIPVAFLIVFVGMGALVLFPGIAAEEAFPTVINDLLPVGVSGLVIAALLAAVMSSADTCLLTTSTILSVDICKRAFRYLGEHRTLLISRIGIVVIGLLALVIALKLRGIIDSLLLAYTIFTSGVVIPLLAGFYKDKLKLKPVGALAGIVGGGGVSLGIELSGIGISKLIALAVCVILLFGVSWIAPGSGKKWK